MLLALESRSNFTNFTRSSVVTLLCCNNISQFCSLMAVAGGEEREGDMCRHDTRREEGWTLSQYEQHQNIRPPLTLLIISPRTPGPLLTSL